MNLDEAVGGIENCQTIVALTAELQRIIEHYGFASFAFLDIGTPGIDDPFTVTTNDSRWDATYRDNGFVHSDPIIPIVRRTNTPFAWGAVPLPERRGRRKPKALHVMEAAQDHGYTDGFVVPFHFIDRLGRVNSASCAFFWKDQQSRFFFFLKHKKHDLHIIMLYWAQRMMDVAAKELNRRDRFTDGEGNPISANMLTDRERDVLAWAARGKTMSETATILSVADATVETHIKHAMQKLGAGNKTHAVARALFLGLIDI